MRENSISSVTPKFQGGEARDWQIGLKFNSGELEKDTASEMALQIYTSLYECKLWAYKEEIRRVQQMVELERPCV